MYLHDLTAKITEIIESDVKEYIDAEVAERVDVNKDRFMPSFNLWVVYVFDNEEVVTKDNPDGTFYNMEDSLEWVRASLEGEIEASIYVKDEKEYGKDLLRVEAFRDYFTELAEEMTTKRGKA
jgi:hypothetical protein